MSYNPMSNDPNVDMNIILGADLVQVKLNVKDYRRFIEDLLVLKNGGKKRFENQKSNKRIVLEVINDEQGTIRVS